jgi:predicted CXXCH cytochrome family protein
MDHYRLTSEFYKCGNVPNGSPCPLGPIGAKCSREHSNSNSEMSCRPLRTLRWWNRSIQMAMALAALIGVSLAWSNIGGKRIVAPGSLSRSHAQLLTASKHGNPSDFAIDAENRCVACHPGADGSKPASGVAKQSELCLKCHLTEMPDAAHGSPHGLFGKALEGLVAKSHRPNSNSSWAKQISVSAFDWKGTSTECSQCHREHQGAMHNLSEMTSQRCQACHQQKYQSFSTDHPEFNNYPYDRTKNIEFNHAKHRDLHFSKKNANFDCKTCHVQSEQVGAVGQVFRSVPFEQACASCHTAPIKSAIQDGLIVLQIPSINRKELVRMGADLGAWPEQASQLTDGIIPPIMRMLIEAEPGGPDLLSGIPASGQLNELDMSNEQNRTTLTRLTSITKQMLRKLANEGQPGFRSSVGKLVSTTRDPWLDQLANGLPPDLFRAAWTEWFEDENAVSKISRAEPVDTRPFRPAAVRFSQTVSNVDDDLLVGSNSLLNPRDDDLLTTSPGDLLSPHAIEDSQVSRFKDSRTFDQLAFGGWMIDRQRMAIVYVPNGHADQWLSRWIELEEMRPKSANPKIGIALQCRQCHSLNSIESPASNSPAAALPVPQDPKSWSVAFRQTNQTPKMDLDFAGENNLCWRAKRRSATLRQITKFDHTPHLTLPSISDCRSCHQLTSTSMHSANQEFSPMKKSQCASCHQSNAAGDSCTQCHNYHVGIQGWLDASP